MTDPSLADLQVSVQDRLAFQRVITRTDCGLPAISYKGYMDTLTTEIVAEQFRTLRV